MKDYYNILRINPASSTNEIKKAFKSMAKIWHPDINKSPNARATMQDIIEAYLVLSNQEKKYQYDKLYRTEIINRENGAITEAQKQNFETEKRKAKEIVDKPITYFGDLVKVGLQPFKIVVMIFVAYFLMSLLFYIFN